MVSDKPEFLPYLNSQMADVEEIRQLRKAEPLEHPTKEKEILEDHQQAPKAPIITKGGKLLKKIPRKP